MSLSKRSFTRSTNGSSPNRAVKRRAQRRVPDRIDVLPDPPKLAQGFTAVFTPDEVYTDFDRYVKLFQEIFGTK
jgi:hypothetical protein